MTQLLFGRYFWVWVLSFLGAASYLSASSINQLMRLSLSKEYEMPVASSPSFGKDEQHLPSNVILQGKNIFDPNGSAVTPPKQAPKKRPKAVVQKAPPAVRKVKVEGCPPIPLNDKIPISKARYIRLKGTGYVVEDPLLSVAAVYVKVTIQASSASRSRGSKRRYYRRTRYRRRGGRSRWQTEIFRAGEEMMPGIRLCLIGPKEVIIYRKKKFERLVLEKGKRKTKMRYYGSLGIALPKEDSSGPGQIRIDAIDKRTISRSTVQNFLANPMSHAMSARIMPHYQNGRPAGLRLVWVRKKSLYAQLGLKSGDIVQSINGKTLNVANALGLYSQLPYAKNLKVNIIRRGVRRQLFFNIK